jgi:hypothetical protein
MVEKVAQKKQAAGTALVKAVKQSTGAFCVAVQVGCDHVFHVKVLSR